MTDKDSARIPWPAPDSVASILPVLPMVYVAWADGDLAPDELREIRTRLEGIAGLNESGRQIVRRWLDPEQPPSPQELQTLLRTIRRHSGNIAAPDRSSLSDLGAAFLSDSRSPDDPAVVKTRLALSDIEQVLGLVGREATAEILAPVTRDAAVRVDQQRPFDPRALAALLDAPYETTRQRVRSLLQGAEFAYQYELSKEDYRALVLSWTQSLARHGLGAMGFPRNVGGAEDFGGFIAAFETLGFHDLSLVVKFGVQFGLFGGSVLFLGTEKHHKRYLRDIGTLALPGCFAMTELGHGSNVWDLETLATYDREDRTFVIHTPSETARKEWIGNAAEHGRIATVFAQLVIDDERFGVHAFLVPIRDGTGATAPGVRIEDCGHKEGLNGVDNGRIWFDQVRVPYDALLNRFGDVTEGGEYFSPINSPFKRFFTMLGTLVGGRISIAAAGLSAAKSGLTIAVRYAGRRRQFGPAGESEVPLLWYRTHQRRLMPRVAAAYALSFAQQDLVVRFLARTEETSREVEALAAGLKAYSSWNTIDTLQTCREACGAQGYLTVNRIPYLKADTDIFATFEGDNVVLMQLLAKALLTDFRQQFGEMRFWGTVKFLAERTASAAARLNPIVPRQTDESHLRDVEFQRDTLRYRSQRLLLSVARRLKSRIDEGVDSFVAFNQCQDHLVSLGKAHVEAHVYDCLESGIARAPTDEIRKALTVMRELFGLSAIEKDSGWFLENGVLEGNKAKAIRQVVNVLAAESAEMAGCLVDGFGIPDSCLAAPIAFSIDPRSSSATG